MYCRPSVTRAVFSSCSLAQSLLAHLRIAVGLVGQTLGLQLLDSVAISLPPIDIADGVVGFGVLRIDGDGLQLPGLGIVVLADVQVERGNSLDAADILGVLVVDLA